MATTQYLGNQNLKAAGVVVNFTKEQIEEYIKCSKDPIYFIINYCKIVTLDNGLQPFDLYECQKNKINVINDNRRIILMEGRQQGKTTTSAAYILWYTLFSPSRTVAILANKAAAAREVLSRYQVMYEHLPVWLQQGVTTWNKGDIELENGSKVFTAATSSSAIRGRSVNMLYVDEAAIIPNTVAEDFFTSVYPTISAGQTTKILLSSTPLGYNHFWKFWNDAENDRNGFVNLFIPYWEIPGRDENWAREQQRLLGDLKYNQEVLCKFLGSSLTLINSDVIGSMSAIPPISHQDGLDIYEEPQPDHTYVIVADTAKGVGGDHSAFTLVDITEVPFKISVKYRNNRISPLLYPSVIHNLAKKYNEAFVLIEINSSEQVAHILYNEYEYENLLFVNRSSRGQKLSSGFGSSGTQQMGIQTDKKIKRIGCSTFKSLVEEKKLIITDAEIISEISTFIQSKGSFAADDGYHDDLVMTLVLFSWLFSDPFFKDLTNINIRQEMYKTQIDMIEQNVAPFGIINNGMEDDTYTDSAGQNWQIVNDNSKYEFL